MTAQPNHCVVLQPSGKVCKCCHNHSRGPAAARNTGAGVVTTGWIAFIDADTSPDPGWIADLMGRIEHLDRSAAAEADHVVVAAPRIYPLTGSGWGGWFEQRVCALDLGGVPSDVGVGQTVSYVPSAALLRFRPDPFARWVVSTNR